ncbi:hypothetical protein [Coralliovum pocilloporae]|uniref:hypothetical protein n=1 Tax=Coralliovum pocilloporae TaxID=3066369 RepID=UPI003306B230
MKKNNRTRKPKQTKSRKAPSAPASPDVDEDKRAFLRKVRNGAIGLTVLAGGGLLIGQTISSSAHDHDLTRVGNGTPTVVQIHDPECALCQALQKATRNALEGFDEGRIDYVIADIRTSKGLDFASRYRVPHVTLLLFDGKGELKQVLQGQRGQYELANAFRLLLES